MAAISCLHAQTAGKMPEHSRRHASGLNPPVIGSGGGSGTLTVSPATLDFGDVDLGSTATQPASLAANGADITVYSGTSSDPEFAVQGLTFPFTIPDGQSVQFMASFQPQNTGTETATFTFVSSAADSPTTESLQGMATTATGHSVDLSWNASTSNDVVGYNIYRSQTSGGPYSRINTDLDPSTQYTDDSVLAGMTYFYVATAVDSNNQESDYSNEAEADILPGSRPASRQQIGDR